MIFNKLSCPLLIKDLYLFSRIDWQLDECLESRIRLLSQYYVMAFQSQSPVNDDLRTRMGQVKYERQG